jgi:hypothetical protein
MKSYLEIMSDIYKSFHNDISSGSQQLSEFLDKINVWTISLSTGSIALLIGSTEKIDFISQSTINITLLFLVLTILLGFIGRGLSAISSYLGHQMNSMFKFSLKMNEIPYSYHKLCGDESPEEIYNLLLSIFDANIPKILDDMESLSKDELERYEKKTRQYFIDFSKAKKVEMDNSLNRINEIMIDSFGLKKNHFKKVKKDKIRLKGILMSISTKVSIISYALSMLTFLTAIIFISLKYYCELK